MPHRTNGKAEDCILVIFGATGDLTHRKLYPAIHNLHLNGYLPERFSVVAIGRRDLDSQTIRQEIVDSVNEFSRVDLNQDGAARTFLERFHYFRLDFSDASGFSRLQVFLEELGRSIGTENRVYFLAVAPEYFASITEQVNSHGMAPNRDSWQRLVIEKPFGESLDSAAELNSSITRAFSEDHVYRIDHYLGKEMAQNLMVIRFANTLFEPLWNNRYVEQVQITIAENGGVEGRGPYYEQAGALRDMVQNHMLQLLALAAMEPPVDLKTESVRDEKVKVLRSLDIEASDVVRGQYGSGGVNGRPLKAYRDEPRVDDNTNVETFLALRARVENFRWAGVPFYLRTGKRLPQKYSEIIVQFKSLPGILYFKDRPLDANYLGIRVQPDEGVYVRFNAKRPGTDNAIVPVTMDFCQNCMEGLNSPEAYERLLFDVMRGDSTLFTRWDEVEHSWRFVDKITAWWHDSPAAVPVYRSGTWGPPGSDLLLQAQGHRWLSFR